MKFIYTPEGSEPRVFNYKPGKLLNVEAEKIEDLTGWTYTEFGQKLMTESMKAYHALLYIFLKRSNPTLTYDQVVFGYDEIDLDYDEEEVEKLIGAMVEERDRQGLSEESEKLLSQLLAERPQASEVAEEPIDPKASPDFEQPGSGSSPTSSIYDQPTLTDSPSTN